MKDLYVVNCCRTAIGSFGGSLKNTPAAEMGAVVVKEALKRANVAPENVDELMFGCILTAAQGQNVARQVSIKAGIPYSVPAYTVGMVCGSGMKSVIEGARSILAGDSDIVVCGGTENMSAAPYASMDARWGARMGDKKLVDTMIKDGLWDAYNNYHMGTTAENINDLWGITRAEQDAFAAASQQKACAARDSGRFDDEIVPVMVKVKKDMVPFAKDEYPKEGVTAEGIAKLKGAFPVGPESPNPQVVHTFEPIGIKDAADKGTQRVTAASASGINVSYYKMLTFTISAFFAGITGALYACSNAALSTTSFAFTNGSILNSVFIVVMVVVGGMGSLTGSVIAAVVLFLLNYTIKNGAWVHALPAFLQNVFTYPMLVYSIALIVVIMFRPRGIMGSREFALCDVPQWPAKLRAGRMARKSLRKEAGHHV